MPNNKPMNPVKARIYFQLSDIEPGILTIPQEVYEELLKPGFRRVEHDGIEVVGEYQNGCGDETRRKEFYALINDLSKGIPQWLRKADYTVEIEGPGFPALPLSVNYYTFDSPPKCQLQIESGNWALALEAHRALASLTELTYCAACGCASHNPAEEGSYEPGKGWHCAACHRRLFDSRP